MSVKIGLFRFDYAVKSVGNALGSRVSAQAAALCMSLEISLSSSTWTSMTSATCSTGSLAHRSVAFCR